MKYLKKFESFKSNEILDVMQVFIDDEELKLSEKYDRICDFVELIPCLNKIEEHLEYYSNLKVVKNFDSIFVLNIDKLKPEIDYINNVLDQLVVRTYKKKYPNQIFYFIDDELFIEQDLKDKCFYCNYENFMDKFILNYTQTLAIFKYVLDEYFNLKDYATEQDCESHSFCWNRTSMREIIQQIL